jgi:predicted nucleic acid-binding protein
MFWFFTKLLLAAIFFIVARVVTSAASTSRTENDRSFLGMIRNAAYLMCALFVVHAVIFTSLIRVPNGQFATLKRGFFGKALPPGRVIAEPGGLGPQPGIITAGFHVSPFITLVNEVEYHDVLHVPPGKCAVISATDGLYADQGAAFAPQWGADKFQMINDATYFLGEGKGFRGPQSTVLFPGAYTPNPYLWPADKIRFVEATTIEQGTVGVVKAYVRSPVDFGQFKHELSTDGKLKVLTSEMLPKGAANTWLVPVGNIGVWEIAIPNGKYYINPDCYVVTKVPSVAIVYSYRGGYTRRDVTLDSDQKGVITQVVTTTNVPADPQAADSAIVAKVEGWEVPQEARVLVQINPQMAPYVVASLGLSAENAQELIENRVVTPIMRSVIRDVLGGAQINFQTQEMVLDKETKEPIMDAFGVPTTKVTHTLRVAKVLDLIENRSFLEGSMEEKARVEAAKEGINIMEIRLSESAIPAELMAARKREQLAQQISKALTQEEQTQINRQKTENARALAEQQETVVAGQVKAQVAEQVKMARETEGAAEKGYMIALAEGQKAQVDVMGAEAAMRLQMYQLTLKQVAELVKDNPKILDTVFNGAGKFVPNTLIIGGGGSNGSDITSGLSAAILNNLLNKTEQLKSGTRTGLADQQN